MTPHSCLTSRVLCTRLQVQCLKHWRAFAFSADGRKLKPPALRVVVDSYYPAHHAGINSVAIVELATDDNQRTTDNIYDCNSALKELKL